MNILVGEKTHWKKEKGRYHRVMYTNWLVDVRIVIFQNYNAYLLLAAEFYKVLLYFYLARL